MPILSCKEMDCQRKVLARGMCSTHYSYWHREKNPLGHICAVCGEAYSNARRDSEVCSMRCRQDLAIQGRLRRYQQDAKDRAALVKYLRPRVWAGQTVKPRNGDPLVAGVCAYCPTYFVGWPGSMYCSDRCSNNASWKRRYDGRGKFKVTDKLRLAIYERDAFECQLCKLPVDVALHYQDPMAPTLDHIIPQSRMLVPDHSISNLRLAHRLCNSIRGDRIGATAA